jgi:hypothetical protein
MREEREEIKNKESGDLSGGGSVRRTGGVDPGFFSYGEGEVSGIQDTITRQNSNSNYQFSSAFEY